MNKIFVLSWSHYEEYVPHILFGPEEYSKEKFIDLTDSLLDKAVLFAIEKESKDEYPSYIGWESIVEQVVVLLKDYGFEVVNAIESNYFGGSIIDEEKWSSPKISQSINKSLIDYNLIIRNKL